MRRPPASYGMALITGLMVLASATAQVKEPDYRGVAIDRSTGDTLYIEKHKEILLDGKRVGLITDYTDKTGRTIVQRKVDFKGNLYRPEFRLTDLRDGYVEGAERAGDSTILVYKRDSAASVQRTTVRIPEPAVIDAGFNNFIQERWNDITSGETQYFNFGVPFEQDYYGFRVYKEKQVVEKGRDQVIVNADIDNFIIRLFLDPIVLTYDAQTRRLVRYEGISNINDERGRSYFVRITYDPYGP